MRYRVSVTFRMLPEHYPAGYQEAMVDVRDYDTAEVLGNAVLVEPAYLAVVDEDKWLVRSCGVHGDGKDPQSCRNAELYLTKIAEAESEAHAVTRVLLDAKRATMPGGVLWGWEAQGALEHGELDDRSEAEYLAYISH